MKPKTKINTIVVIGDTHCGSDVGLMPPTVQLDGGQTVHASARQKWLWKSYQDFLAFAIKMTQDEPFAVVFNGDIVDGCHHQTLDLISGNMAFQQKVAVDTLGPIARKAALRIFIRGTAAHTGQQSEDEELVAKMLDGRRNPETGQYTWQAALMQLGNERVHFAHHIGTSSAHAYKSSPAMRLMAAAFAWAGETGNKPPTMLIRSHAHDYIEVKRSGCRVTVCPCWQWKTGWIWGKDTIGEPSIGGLVIRRGIEGVHIRERTYRGKQAKTIVL
jgi:hypothetical protein